MFVVAVLIGLLHPVGELEAAVVGHICMVHPTFGVIIPIIGF